MLELEDHVDLATSGIGEQARLVHGDTRHLTHGEVGIRPSALKPAGASPAELMDAWTPDEIRTAVTEPAPDEHVSIRKVDPGDHVDDVHAEAVDSAIQPPSHRRVGGFRTSGFSQLRSGCLRENRCR